LIAMLLEISVAQGVLRRFGITDRDVAGHIFLINLSTWGLFLVAVEKLGLRGGVESVAWLVGLEVAVIVVEAWLIRAASRGRMFPGRIQWKPLGWWQAACVSSVANVVSIAISVAVPVIVFLIVKGMA